MKLKVCTGVITLFSAAVLILGCDGSSSSSTSSPADERLRSVLSISGLSGDPSLGRDLPSVNSGVAQLGKKLFFSKTLGGNHDTACVSCHHPALGGGDNLPLPMGVGAVKPEFIGPGRRLSEHLGPNVPRNSPSTLNIALFDRSLFWDGRVESLGRTKSMNGSDGLGIRTPDVQFGQADPLAGNNLATAQARFPITSAAEMKGEEFAEGGGNQAIRNALASRLASNPAWVEEFNKVYPEQAITYELAAEAIGTYERSQVFINNNWKRYLDGDNAAISEAAKRGALMFFASRDEGGAGCADCHSGDFFTDESFHTIAIPQLGEGKGDGARGNDDFGRYRETKDPADLYAFRTPTLLNVEVTKPYGHSGAYGSLEEVVLHHLNCKTAISLFNEGKVQPGLESENWSEYTQNAYNVVMSLRDANLVTIYDYPYDEQIVSDLVEFLKALTDPCVKDLSCLSPWVANSTDDPSGQLELLVTGGN